MLTPSPYTLNREEREDIFRRDLAYRLADDLHKKKEQRLRRAIFLMTLATLGVGMLWSQM